MARRTADRNVLDWLSDSELFTDDTFPCYETGGEIIEGGHFVELIRDPSGKLTLLDSRPKDAEGGSVPQAFVPPKLHPSLEELLTLPTQPAPCGSTADFFKEICEVFSKYGFAADNAKLFAYYTIATWLVGALPIAPCLVIAGARPEAQLAMQLLGCLVRHGLSIGEISSAELKRLAIPAQPTLLIGHLKPSLYRILALSIYPGACVPLGNGLVDLQCAKVAYAGLTLTDGIAGEPILAVNLPPRQGKLPGTTVAIRQQIKARFQPRLLAYRLQNVARIGDSNFDAPTLPSNLRILAQALGSCIVDAPDLQAGITDLLVDQQELLAADHWVDPQHVALEAILERCHRDQNGSRLGIGQIADAATKILRDRGETAKIEPKLVGLFVRALGFSPKRDMQGYALQVDDDLRRKAHQLARDYQLGVVPNAEDSCSLCAGISEQSSGKTAT
jgi:hypothetical protein